MGDKEQILIADDSSDVIDGLQEYFGLHPESGHSIVGTAASVEEVEELMRTGLQPTVALVDNKFPYRGAGEKALRIIKQYSPNTIVISFSNDPGLEWGDQNWSKPLIEVPGLLFRALTHLQHKHPGNT
ncbi:MAG: hypothetical protein UW22_C0032G0007 [Candidatus Gottesmanbacteria bacterium GW2011_GWB1_44_11c]|uniref:Response regulatory domain-containing protein n=2 Tax=Candidatus Gottesmaniibacteriota TaxID=1752720 RepID=A0A0G1LH05_9BACT|nr:MAG: hypothetical protein UW22_C0032G0007 [Candidatus Gottesmanbacteria bacterium GW2011_GWB1_44_11c]KKT59244.1 MAG: hypothetical protein UW52_C0044G0007 [Candidatus Gottesmanbacteria bacterium GW2011_GWA1_44_24b]HCM82364.1 hypothetical protein [Patescibacteria group bacterium]